MKIVVLDGYALNPGDLSWDFLKKYGNVTYYERTDCKADAIARMQNMDIAAVLEKRKLQLVLKRAMDIVISGCALLAIWPVLLWN